MSERRTTERKKVLLDARWKSMSGRHEARVDDVSLGGCFVNTHGHVELGEPVELEILLPSGDWLTLHGAVASYHPGVGFGMWFRFGNAAERTDLKELIASAADRPV
ncbi:MAG: PilZ domain-containing protein [Acidobacteria bacterium]|nr:PilZ domain-containing protein [Acidobacteriota bacterium]MCA1627174.1 PilZ domain-containing protein [Acidobacteriota bacterium]